MSKCPRTAACPFFNNKIVEKSVLADALKEDFCKSNYYVCARYVIFTTLGREHIPLNLFPNQEKRATEILKKAGK